MERDKRAHIDYCVLDEPAALLWAVNIGSIELHTSRHRAAATDRPTAVAFELDPGEGAGILECCEVALRVRELFDGLGVRSYPKTSGGKGLQVYVPVEGATYGDTKPLARTVAEVLEARTPGRVVSRMARALRSGKVLVDWSQNTEHKSMVRAYSVRARARPIVSAPVTWEEVERAAIDFCVVDELAALLWAVNIGSLELHTSLHTRADLHRPTAIAFDLDPGEGVDVLGCARVALRLRKVLDGIGLRSYVKTSGSKGLQVYAPVLGDPTYAETKPLARAIAEGLESGSITSRSARSLRAGKVLIDWGQNTEHKSMVCAYSVRARPRPTVSTPVAWDEVEAARSPEDLVFELDD
ncbi:MAG TPA: hypothetical protein VN213_06770, partial [Solirubrobacteraceae bacterium]|nr:hypothetical protein [Solirubrobacteraceae bacterium]